MKSPWVRGSVMLAAVVAAVWAVAANWTEVKAAFAQMPGWVLALGVVLSFVYVYVTMFSWRAIITSEAHVPPAIARRIFFSSQVAKYLPGGVWNFVAAAEVGRDYQISRRRSVACLLISIAISIVTGMILAVLSFLLGPGDVASTYWWVGLAIPAGVVVLLPPVLNRLVNAALKIMRREPMEADMTWRATAVSALWATLSWFLVGLQLFLMLTSLGMDATPTTFLRAVGGYALGWTVGFLAVVVPAGVGVREVALGAVLAGTVSSGSLVVVVLASRVMTTVADVVLGLVASFAMRADSEVTQEALAAVEASDDAEA